MKLKSNKKWLRYPLYVILFLLVSYMLTIYVGVQHIKSKQATEQLILTLDVLKNRNRSCLEREYTNTINYSVIFPFVIQSKHKTTVAGYDEYHLWYIFGIWTFERRLNWIT